MARSGWDASDWLQCSSAVVTAVPLTLSCWGYCTSTGTNQEMLGVYNSADDSNSFALYLANNAVINAYSNGSAAATSTAISANTWFHGCAVSASTTDRRAFLNGGGKGTETTSVTPSGLNRMTMGAHGGLSAGLNPFAGSLAEAAVWNVALSDTDVASLALGIHPFLVRPDKLIAYWPLLGYYSPENNLKSNTATMAIQGTLSQAAHTRVLYGWPRSGRTRVTRTAPQGTATFGEHSLAMPVIRRNPNMIGY